MNVVTIPRDPMQTYILKIVTSDCVQNCDPRKTLLPHTILRASFAFVVGNGHSISVFRPQGARWDVTNGRRSLVLSPQPLHCYCCYTVAKFVSETRKHGSYGVYTAAFVNDQTDVWNAQRRRRMPLNHESGAKGMGPCSLREILLSG